MASYHFQGRDWLLSDGGSCLFGQWLQVQTGNESIKVVDDHWEYSLDIRVYGSKVNWVINKTVCYFRTYSDEAKTKLINETSIEVKGHAASGEYTGWYTGLKGTAAANVGRVYFTIDLDMTKESSSAPETYGKSGIGCVGHYHTITHLYSYGYWDVEDIPLLKPPKISNLRNTNKYKDQSGVSASETSISISWDSTGDKIDTSYYRINGGNWIETSTTTSHTISNLTPGTSYKIEVYSKNTAGNSSTLSITIRTRYSPPVVDLVYDSSDLETLTFDWSSDKDLASTEYKIDSGKWVNLGQTGKSGTFTAKWFDPKTKHTIYFRGVSTSTYDSLSSNEDSASGTTLDRSHITTIGECIFGVSIKITISAESNKKHKLQIWTNGNNREPIFTFDDLPEGVHTFNPTQDQLDQMYRCFTNTNSIPIHFLLTTHGDWKDWNDSQHDRNLQLTGIAKTSHIGVNNKQRRAQCFIGIGGKPRRAVAWIGVDNKPRRCI